MSVEQLKVRLSTLRNLRHKAEELASTLKKDLASFEFPMSSVYYFRLPSTLKNLIAGGVASISITPTCTAWMALCAAGEKIDKGKIKEAYTTLLSEAWDTGGLPQNNPFTIAVFARSAGYLVKSGLLESEHVKNSKRNSAKLESDPAVKVWRKCDGKSLEGILKEFLEDPEKNLEIHPFPASPTICYWLIDAIARLRIDLERSSILTVAGWAAAEFRRQHSLVSASHQALMDPIALAMSACVCKCLRRLSENSSVCNEVLKECLFPSNLELEAGVRAFFRCQNEESGIWEKYFPIFHYPASGPNHCWHFEVLEAVVGEFPEILIDGEILDRIDNSLEWLQSNRLSFSEQCVLFNGWNAGGDIKAMRRDEPESWPTSVAHMFLSRLIKRISGCIHETVLTKFGDRVRVRPRDCDGGSEWDKYMDTPFTKALDCGLNSDRNTVKKIITKELLEPADRDIELGSISPSFKLKDRHSAILFGPPGTAKTSLCDAIAKRLGWHFVELSPSDFLGGGLEGIYEKVNEVFEDLLDLFGVVILFDEMDALVQNRDGNEAERKLDVTETLLTTSMLPKLAKLHKGSRSLYFMATNFIGTFDGAITRAGRFDLLIQMGPPEAESKIRGLNVFCKKDVFEKGEDRDEEIEKARSYLRKILDDDDDRKRFGRFTFGETERFFYTLKLEHGVKSVAVAIQLTAKEAFEKAVRQWAGSKITLADGSDALKNFEDEALKVRFQ